ncbi:MAG: rhomboid family intramembrane serine protease [Promethearchaeota archaeon]|nr:MAG: rhomboid family intramembrane serine protease [Candidatus Lokiarchaeota archaeon]
MVYEVQNDRIPFVKQYVSLAIIIANVIVFIWQLTDPTGYYYIYEAAFVPAQFITGQKWWTIITAMFMHGDIVHILMNMWFFYVVADNCEKEMGHILFAITYFASGFGASLLHMGISLLNPIAATIPSLGASGAIFGIVAVYAILFPNNQIAVLSRYRAYRISAKVYFFFYFGIQILYGIIGTLSGLTTGTAYWAHIGGFIVGAFFALIFKVTKRGKT